MDTGRWHVWLTWIAIGAASLLRPQLTSSHAALQPASADQPDVSQPEPPDPAEFEEFGWKFVEAIWENDPKAANKLIDWVAILDLATPNLGSSPMATRWRNEFYAGFKSATDGPNGLPGRISSYLQKGGDFTFLRTRNVDGHQRVILRQIQAGGGVEYYDMVVKRGDDGVLRAVDIYVATSGEMLSDLLRRTILPALQNQLPNVLGKLSPADRDYIQSLPALRRMDKHLIDDEPAQALEVYRSLPKSVRERKVALARRMQAALNVDDEEYLAAIEDFRRLHPEDRSVDIITIDWYTLKEDYDKAIEGVDRLDAQIGGDPYLQVLRGSLLFAQDKLDGAKALARIAIEEEPTLEDAYWLLVNISLQQEDFTATVELLNTLERELEIEFEDLTTVEGYEEFVKSKQYRDWLAKRSVDSSN